MILEEIDPLLLNEKQVAAMLGVSTQTVARWRKTGAIAYIKGRRLVRFRRDDVAAFIRKKDPEAVDAEALRLRADAERQRIRDEVAKLMAMDATSLSPSERTLHASELRHLADALDAANALLPQASSSVSSKKP
jgi:excisionase family DNA binding protein